MVCDVNFINKMMFSHFVTSSLHNISKREITKMSYTYVTVEFLFVAYFKFLSVDFLKIIITFFKLLSFDDGL